RVAGAEGPRPTGSIAPRAAVVGDGQRLLEPLHLAVALLRRVHVAGRRDVAADLPQQLVQLEAEGLEIPRLELLERQLARDHVTLRDVAHHRVGGSPEEDAHELEESLTRGRRISRS